MFIKTIYGLFAATILLALQGQPPFGSPKESAADSLSARTHVAGYRHWTRVNPTPVIFHAAPATQCANPFPSQRPSLHRDKYITVYVNALGKRAMLTQQKPSFPVGSVIVKEKSSQKDGSAIELMTVMVKREKRFDPTGGDWEYAVLDGKTATVQAQGKLANCRSCHQQQRDQGYIFRDGYLPLRLYNRLKQY